MAISRIDTTGMKPLSFGDPRHLEAHQFLVDESYLLDAQLYDEWLANLTEDIHYSVPVRVTTARSSDFDTSPGMAHFDDDMYSLKLRVARFATEHAWTEDPPSRLRHYVTNVRSFETVAAEELFVQSATLVFRSRGDNREPDFISATREDILRREGGSLKLSRRLVIMDESVVRMQNLAIFL
ncbi:MAG: 3-phenylpropionate/cinnamic acid dioxygenase subunit beta [Actinomycetota bacterium]|nr:MAG: 3-phenylpropionate/cinnamic acid dioxygenase subunit beta [Actinomycetota bacterium]